MVCSSMGPEVGWQAEQEETEKRLISLHKSDPWPISITFQLDYAPKLFTLFMLYREVLGCI